VFLAARYGEISAVASKEKLKIGQNDRWIIAEAADLGANLITFDQVQAQLARECIARVRASFAVRLLGGEG
jgi:predicted nucleic acid-binding protein